VAGGSRAGTRFLAERAYSRLLRGRGLWAGALALVLVANATLYILAQRQYAASENAQRQQSLARYRDQLDRAISAELEALAGRAGRVAAAAPTQRVVEGVPNPDDRSWLGSLARGDVDSLLIQNSSQTRRLSAAVREGALYDQPADSDISTALAVLTGRASASQAVHPVAGIFGQHFAAVAPVASRTDPTFVVGWVALARPMSALATARIGRYTLAQLTGWPAEGIDTRLLPGHVRNALHAPAQPGARVTLVEGSPGFAIVRNDAGAPYFVYSMAGASAPAPDQFATSRLLLLGAGPMLALAAGLVWFGRRLRVRRGEDARYKAIIDQAADGILIADSQTQKVIDANPALLTRLGYSMNEIRTLTLSDIFAVDPSSSVSALERLRAADPDLPLDVQQRRKDGVLIDAEVRCNVLTVHGRKVSAYVAHDVSLRRKAEQQLFENQQRLDRMAHHDQLTGLPNRHYLASFLPDAIAAAKAAGMMLGVVFLDLDRFKHINDSRGHETGDRLLQEVARRVRAGVRESDVVIRMGGDEFVVVLRNIKSYDEVTQGANRIIAALNQPITVDERPLQTTASIGVSVFPRDGADMVELLKHSDTAMYQAKDRGRNNVQLFTPVMNRKLKQRVAVETSLRDALRLKQLDVHFQPFVNLRTRRIVGFEALIRWRHPVHGMIPADRFIPVAEETGLVVPIGDYVLHRTMQSLSAWRQAGAPLVPVSVNVAPAQLQRGDLHSLILKLLKTHGFGPEFLQLEMTERAVFDHGLSQSGERRQDVIARLRDLGIKIAIDDFGTGYSSLSYLKHWRVDSLKIDRSFVRDLVTDSSDLAIVSAIVAIARHLNIDVVAEGIEGFQQAEALRQLGCTMGQGYLFAKPMPADDCLRLLTEPGEDGEEQEDMLASLATGS
jgi:diguanylate cyclase (GGDEF)-like protein/PAS domain S-box-containing protein